jgi:hypothetical protein
LLKGESFTIQLAESWFAAESLPQLCLLAIGEQIGLLWGHGQMPSLLFAIFHLAFVFFFLARSVDTFTGHSDFTTPASTPSSCGSVFRTFTNHVIFGHSDQNVL